MLGILIGVAAVVAMLALGRGAQKAIETQLASLGSNMLLLRPGAVRVGGVAQDVGAATRLTIEDVAAIRERITGVKEVAPNVTGRVRATSGNKNWNTLVRGTVPAYARMRASQPEIGRFFTDEENQRRARVALIGLTVVRELFGGENPVGEMIKLNRVNFQVIGVLPEKGATSFQDQDDVIVIPVLTAMHRLLGKDYIDYIDIEAQSPADLQPVTDAVMEQMLARHRVPPSQRQDAYQIRNLADIQAAMTETRPTMSLLLAAIATISLLVGGIGIMNIMLVSVTESTREVGLRKAVGAKRRHIMLQFLLEATFLSLAGGIVGILLGMGLSSLVSGIRMGEVALQPAVTLPVVLLAFSLSAAIGIFFGFYPASRAARLDPIQALRYE